MAAVVVLIPTRAEVMTVFDVSGISTDIAGFEEGTSLLVTGSSTQVRGVVFDALADAHENREGIVVIATDRNASYVADSLSERSDAYDPSLLGVVDTTAQSPELDGVAIESLGSAGDLTGISLGTAKLIRRLDGENRPIRLGLVSISTLLMYVDLQTVFRFLHVFTSRVSSGGWLGVFALDPDMHDEKAVSTIRAAFDAELRVSDDGTVQAVGDGIVSS